MGDSSSSSSSAVRNLGASSLAALLTRSILYPLDAFRIRVQSSSVDYRLLFRSITASPRQLYNGFAPTVILTVPASAVYLTSFDQLKSTITQHSNSLPHYAVVTLAAVGAELLSGLLWTPMDVIRSRLIVHGNSGGRGNALKLVANLIRSRQILRGYWLGISVFIPHSITYFLCYEHFKSTLRHSDTGSTTDTTLSTDMRRYLMAAGMAAGIAGLISNPLEVIKTRWQTASLSPNLTFPIMMRKIMYNDKDRFTLRWMARGLPARLMAVCPSAALSMTLYEVFKLKL